MISRLRSNPLLLSALAKRQVSNGKQQSGFTLIELLVVIVIIGILSAIALPAFLNQTNKGKIASAKALASSAAKECQLALNEGVGITTLSTQGSAEVTLAADPTTCTTTTTFRAQGVIKDSASPYAAFQTAVAGSDGSVYKSCESAIGGCTDSTDSVTSLTVAPTAALAGDWN